MILTESHDIDDWETDPDFVNDISSEDIRWGGARDTGVIDMRELCEVVQNEDAKNCEDKVSRRLDGTYNTSHGYGGKFGVESDRMDVSAVGHDYQISLQKHASQKDYATGFGGKYGVEKDKKDRSALGWDHVEKSEKHCSQVDYKTGFGGEFGVLEKSRDKSALGWDHVHQVDKHESQKDYKRGFGGEFGVELDRQDKCAVGWDHKSGEDDKPHSSQQKSGADLQEVRSIVNSRLTTEEGNDDFTPVGTRYVKTRPEVPVKRAAELKKKFEEMVQAEKAKRSVDVVEKRRSKTFVVPKTINKTSDNHSTIVNQNTLDHEPESLITSHVKFETEKAEIELNINNSAPLETNSTDELLVEVTTKKSVKERCKAIEVASNEPTSSRHINVSVPKVGTLKLTGNSLLNHRHTQNVDQQQQANTVSKVTVCSKEIVVENVESKVPCVKKDEPVKITGMKDILPSADDTVQCSPKSQLAAIHDMEDLVKKYTEEPVEPQGVVINTHFEPPKLVSLEAHVTESSRHDDTKSESEKDVKNVIDVHTPVSEGRLTTERRPEDNTNSFTSSEQTVSKRRVTFKEDCVERVIEEEIEVDDEYEENDGEPSQQKMLLATNRYGMAPSQIHPNCPLAQVIEEDEEENDDDEFQPTQYNINNHVKMSGEQEEEEEMNGDEEEEGDGVDLVAIAMYDYQAAADDEISFDPDDLITSIQMVDAGWWLGECHGRFGLFPANYVQLQPQENQEQLQTREEEEH